jgi:type I restriction enzyme, R subunit
LPEVQQWWKDHVKGDPAAYERDIIDAFSTEGTPDILIVVDKLLTGFDEPRDAVLYIDKPLKQHNLIQAIARVNRLHEDKQYGLLIDYRGILRELDTAIKEYQDLASKTQGGYDIEDIKGLYTEISTEYKRLPLLHDRLWSIFRTVKNKSDLEQYRQILVPQFRDGENGEPYDTRQKVREDFYEALTEFGMCLKTALSSRSFFEDTSVAESKIKQYKDDLRFFMNLRKIAKQDAQETVDFSAYEDQIRKLVDRHVVGEDVKEADGIYLINELGVDSDPAKWSEEKTRNETDIIRSRIMKTIEQEFADDPFAQIYFSQLLRQAIAEAQKLFEHPFKQYALFKDFDQKVANRDMADVPEAITGNKHARAYFGILKLVIGEDKQNAISTEALVDAALTIESAVKTAVSEQSLNPQNIEAAIRQALLPKLFALLGLDKAKEVIERVIAVTRIGISRGEL